MPAADYPGRIWPDLFVCESGHGLVFTDPRLDEHDLDRGRIAAFNNRKLARSVGGASWRLRCKGKHVQVFGRGNKHSLP